MAVVDVDGVVLRYDEAGDPAAPPVVLLHGMGADASTWQAVAAGLADGYRVLAYDQRGHGGSSNTGSYSFELMRDDLCGFADKLGVESFVLIGHSLGGTVACLFAEKYPERLAGLVLEDTAPLQEPLDRPAPVRPDGELPFDWRMVEAISVQLAHPDPAWWDDLALITPPTLIVGGGDTSHVPQELLARAAARIPRAELITIEGAGHLVHGSRDAEFLAVVRPFLDRVRAR